jgi:hypothetical protein
VPLRRGPATVYGFRAHTEQHVNMFGSFEFSDEAPDIGMELQHWSVRNWYGMKPLSCRRRTLEKDRPFKINNLVYSAATNYIENNRALEMCGFLDLLSVRNQDQDLV